jgi:hypothetical protein
MNKFKEGDLVKPTEHARNSLDGHHKWAEYVYPWKVTKVCGDRVQVEMRFKTKKSRRSVWNEWWLEHAILDIVKEESEGKQ